VSACRSDALAGCGTARQSPGVSATDRTVAYIHGFNSSARSHKARLLGERLAKIGAAARFVCPDLPHRPAQAAALLERLLADSPPARTTLVGSSLGGYYATWLAERHALRAVLVNPAVRPYELLRAQVGPQRNLYTGEVYEFTQRHLDELAALEVPRVTPERYLLLACSGDEVLDYRDAVRRYRGCSQRIVDGGDHGFSGFAGHLDAVLDFCGVRG
jgi:predicted esterase YcpF (UPF0227 family)